MENNEQELMKTEKNCQNGSENNRKWTVEEKKAIAVVTFPMIEMQKAYGRTMDAKIVMQGWENKFAGRYSIEQILYALDQYTDDRDDFPSPSNLISILEPEEPRITDAQFIEAQKWQERNQNWSKYTDAAEVISNYRKQRQQERKDYEIKNERVLQIASASVNRINQLTDKQKKEQEDKRKRFLASQIE